MDPLFTSIFDSCWDLGSKFFYWLFDGYIQPKEDFSLLWDETKVINSTGDKPMLKSQNKTAQRQVYTFTIPVGLSIDNFTKNKDAIAQYLHQDIKNIRIELTIIKRNNYYSHQENECMTVLLNSKLRYLSFLYCF